MNWTVKDLIKELECYPPNVEVSIEICEKAVPIDEVYIDADLDKVIIK